MSGNQEAFTEITSPGEEGGTREKEGGQEGRRSSQDGETLP